MIDLPCECFPCLKQGYPLASIDTYKVTVLAIRLTLSGTKRVAESHCKRICQLLLEHNLLGGETRFCRIQGSV